MTRELRRKTPDEILREIHADEPVGKRGYLKILLGYASGAGKSFRMLDEARRRRARGQDVVIGAIQPRIAPDVEPLLKTLELIPLKQIDSAVAVDVDRLIKRRPAVCFIDGLAYDNPPGARNPTRWQDVQELVSAGIKVVASINIHYIADFREQVEAITGKHVAETVPVSFIKSADEIEVVDTPADATRGEQRDEASCECGLSKLRELALVLAADVVDHQLVEYLEHHGIKQRPGTQERILVCVTPRANARQMIQTAEMIAERFHGQLFVAYVNQPAISPADRAALDEKLAAAREAGASIQMLEGEDPVDAILYFARSQGITQLFIGHSQRSGVRARLFGNPVDQLIQRSEGMDVRVFPQ